MAAGRLASQCILKKSLNLRSHRISAHRALTLNPGVPKISEQAALANLRYGYDQATAANAADYRDGHRWRNKAAVLLLDDFDFLVQALFADQANKALETHNKVRSGNFSLPEPTKLEELAEIWHRLLPNRQIEVSGDDIKVKSSERNSLYPASDMSDGERAIFYLIGQVLVAAEKSLLIVDEPELHVHRSVMAKLWDELEAVRRHSAFVFITHDLEFAASRTAQKFIIHEYNPSNGWQVEPVPEETGFGEELTTLILGSRQPILFVEGTGDSLDHAIYRCCFPDWTVVPRGSCEEVIHSVVSMGRNEAFTRVSCSGIVDADDYMPDEISMLRDHGVRLCCQWQKLRMSCSCQQSVEPLPRARATKAANWKQN